MGEPMTSTARNARIAGLLYLLLGIAGPIRLIVVPNMLFVAGNPERTTANIAAHEMLFRIGILSDLAVGVLAIAVTLALYRLFEGVDRPLAKLMVILGSLMVTPIYFVNTLNDMAALHLVTGGDVFAALGAPQRQALAMLFLRLHHGGVVVNEIFWGLWLFPFGVLVIRSRFLPRVLGVWLIVNGFAYLVSSLTGVLFPRYEDALSNVLFPALFGEVAIMLWLVIMGARPARATPTPTPAAA
jgi:hypothetical protein